MAQPLGEGALTTADRDLSAYQDFPLAQQRHGEGVANGEAYQGPGFDHLDDTQCSG